jgi:hypothetical protein
MQYLLVPCLDLPGANRLDCESHKESAQQNGNISLLMIQATHPSNPRQFEVQHSEKAEIAPFLSPSLFVFFLIRAERSRQARQQRGLAFIIPWRQPVWRFPHLFLPFTL